MLKRIYGRTESIVFRKIADECILVPIRDDVGDLEHIYTLNETAARIWELIDGKTNVRAIGDAIAKEYDITPEEAERDIVEHLRQMEGIGAISVQG